jgi:site-specific DNA-methyltransferase (adenine-specific)
VLADDGTIWISCTLLNHPSIGVLLKKLNLWIINDVIWYKRNSPPLLSKTKLVPSTELILVASKSKKYYFDYDKAKAINGGKQMRNLLDINAQRHKTKHPTEKPEALLERIILLGSKESDIILDPFTGSGTTGVVAKKLNRYFIGFEIDEEYYHVAQQRINNIIIPDHFKYRDDESKQSDQMKLVLDKKEKFII